jgi:mono/diheme cytochrome c family protein
MPRPASSVIAPPAARMLAATLVFVTSASLAQSASPSPETLERGRYMVVTGQCNNCHTAGYSASKGTVVESQWLFGDRKGRREPEGTVYATNLRHFVSTLSL